MAMNTVITELQPILTTAFIGVIIAYARYVHNLQQRVAVLEKSIDDMKLSIERTTENIEKTIEPYQMQQEIIEHLRYSVKGEQITFYGDGEKIVTAQNTVKDMGGLDAEQPIWVGEQISYNLNNGKPRVCFVPGVKFTTGLVLTYVDMPTISASIDYEADGSLTLTDFKVESAGEGK